MYFLLNIRQKFTAPICRRECVRHLSTNLAQFCLNGCWSLLMADLITLITLSSFTSWWEWQIVAKNPQIRIDTRSVKNVAKAVPFQRRTLLHTITLCRPKGMDSNHRVIEWVSRGCKSLHPNLAEAGLCWTQSVNTIRLENSVASYCVSSKYVPLRITNREVEWLLCIFMEDQNSG